MAVENEKQPSFNWRGLIRNLLTLLVIVAIIFLFYKLGVVSLFILFGVLLSLVARPIYNLLERINIKQRKIPGALNAILSILLVWCILGGIGLAIVPIITKEITTISKVDPEKILVQLQDPINAAIIKMENLGVLKYVDSTQATPERVVQRTIIYKIPCDTNFAMGSYFTLEGDTIDRELLAAEVPIAKDSGNVTGIRHRKEIVSMMKLLWNDYFSAGKVKKWFGSAFSLVGNIFAIIASSTFLAFFFLRDRKLFMKMISSAVPQKFAEKTVTVFTDSRKLLSRYFIGLMLELLLVMICTTIGLLIVGIRFDLAITIGFFCGLFNIVPYVGPLLGGAFGLLLGVSNYIELDFYATVLPILIKMAIVFSIVQILDNNVLQPLIFSNSVNAHPIEIFLVIVIAGNFAGVIGMIFAVPGYTLLRILARQFFSNFRVVRNLTQNM
jgi:predicted PurR-regulated permease PerM